MPSLVASGLLFWWDLSQNLMGWLLGVQVATAMLLLILSGPLKAASYLVSVLYLPEPPHSWQKIQAFCCLCNVENWVILQRKWTFGQELVPYPFPWVVLHTIPVICLYLWCMLWSWMKSNQFQFIECRTNFSTSWHAKMSLTFNGQI